jgi:hypothetical protein
MYHQSLLSLVLLAAATTVEAKTPSKCYSVPDKDRRFACLAEAKGSESNCNAIRDSDSRAICAASASGKKNRCTMIRDKSRRDACEAGMNY